MPPRRRPVPFAVLAAQAKVDAHPDDTWAVAYFKRIGKSGAGSVPARDFLLESPWQVRAFFRPVVAAVAAAPPHKFAGGGYWEAMKEDMAGYYEVRKRFGGHHYRLFCRLDRDSVGTPPLLVLLCGMRKLDRTVFDADDYAWVRELGEEYLEVNPRSLG